MQVLLVNGSSHKNGNTGLALSMLDNFFQEKNIETKWFHIPDQPLRGCIGCTVFSSGSSLLCDVYQKPAFQREIRCSSCYLCVGWRNGITRPTPSLLCPQSNDDCFQQ